MTNPKDAEKIVKPNADSLAQAAKLANKKGAPPVHSWNPAFCGDLDMRIARDGTWYYLGSPIGRKPLVKLFSSIIRKDGDDYFLVTPVEKVGIIVEDAPFVAVDFDVENAGIDQVITFTTHVDDQATAGADNPIRVTRDAKTGEPSPYVLIRTNLEALIDRKSFYRLVDLGTHEAHEGQDWFGIRSSGVFFPMIPTSEL
ncbi:MAG: proteophosphoglycan precursor [Rhodobacteraceae bacterium]|nr:MAG: proteophosphoglycan precursor [Paracoccaceae bacterium]